MIKVSIIVPYYNVKQYIERCIGSLINQDMSDIELIFVNDCSNDGSVEIVECYKKKYPSLIYSYNNKKNSGAATSRKNGLSYAKGEYVIFVDADDWVEPSMARILYEYANSNNYDIVCSSFNLINEKNEIKMHYSIENYLGCIEGEINSEKRKALAILDFPCYWGRIYKKDFIINSGFTFMEGVHFDEDDVEILLPMLSKRIGLCEDTLYHWFVNEASVTRIKAKHFEERYKGAIFTIEETKRLGLYEECREEIEFFFIRSFGFNNILAFQDLNEYQEFDMEALKLLKKRMIKEYPFYNNNFYYRTYNDCNIKKLFEACMETPDKFIEKYYNEYKELYSLTQSRISTLLIQLNSNHGKVALWGAGKKTRTFIYYNPEVMKNISYIVDLNTKLHGLYIDNKYKVNSYEEIEQDVTSIIVMNHNHVKSVRKMVKCNNKNINVIDMDYYLLYGVK